MNYWRNAVKRKQSTSLNFKALPADEDATMENGSYNNCPDMPSQQVQAEGNALLNE